MGADASNTNTVGISLSYGSQSSKSTQYSEQNTAQGSTLNAGRDLSVIATGSGARGTDGDLTVEGSQLKAGNDITLAANRDLYLRSAQNTQLLDGKNESKGGSVGLASAWAPAALALTSPPASTAAKATRAATAPPTARLPWTRAAR